MASTMDTFLEIFQFFDVKNYDKGFMIVFRYQRHMGVSKVQNCFLGENQIEVQRVAQKEIKKKYF